MCVWPDAMSAVRLVLVLCVATPLRPARCQSAGALSETDPADSQCYFKLQMLIVSDAGNILFDSTYYEYEKNKHNQIVIPYGISMTVWCTYVFADKLTSPHINLTIAKDGVKLQTDDYYSATEIKIHIDMPHLQNSVYGCNDIQSGCQRSAVVTVIPALKVFTNERDMSFEQGFHPNSEFSIDYGNSITLSCSASSTSRIIMTKDGEELLTENENNDTIKYFHGKPDVQISKYVCSDLSNNINVSGLIKVVPLIYTQSPHISYVTYGLDTTKEVIVTYGESIEVVCCGSGVVKLISSDEYYNKVIVNVNKTTVQSVVRNLNVKETVFTCVDSEVPDCISTLRVKTALRMEITSPNVRRVGSQYAVKYGDPIEIICSWYDAETLTMYANRKAVMKEVQKINNTLIKYNTFVNIFNEISRFDCYADKEQAFIEVRILFEVLDFRCVSHAQLQYLNCSWRKSHIDGVIYTLSSADINNEDQVICSQSPSVKSNEFIFCTYDYQKDIEVFSLLMQSCKGSGCFKQTFSMDHASIVKLPPPERLRVSNPSSRRAVLYWAGVDLQIAGKYFDSNKGHIQYKVVYWYSGINPREINASLVSCDHVYCEIDVPLPCPATFYEVRVYQKLTTAIGEEFWSDPRTVTFVTDPDDKADDVDSICFLKPHKNKEVMKYFVEELKDEVRNEMPQLRNELVPLKDKLALIRELLEQLE